MLSSCGSGKFEKNADGVTVNVTQSAENDVRKVRLQVLGDKIIRVSATPDKKFSTDESLVTVLRPGKTDFKVEETDSTVSVITAEVRATVTLSLIHI